MRKFLVFFRAGTNSLHPRIIAEDPLRNWDCCVSWYSQPLSETCADRYITGGENKLEAFRDFFRSAANDSPYEYYLVVDDDIDFAPGDISRFFDLCEKYALFLAQPALRWGTNSNHDVTLWNPICRIRASRFIEVMAPCFSHQAVEQLFDTFSLSKSTWGIDYAWSSLLQDSNRISIVDAIRVAHTKPVNLLDGAFYRKMKALGASPEQEYGHIKSSFPSFGGNRSEKTGHRFALPLPNFVGDPLTKFFEKLKKNIHRRLIA